MRGIQMMGRTVILGGFLCGFAGLAFPAETFGQTPSIEQILQYVPKHFDQEYDKPTPQQYAACKITVVRQGKTMGWEVQGPQGQTLFKFMDTNGDSVVDQWSYFRNGQEVYRDNDTNFNRRVDQSRWLNAGGTRWSVDQNEDGRIDGWKIISPEEVSQVAIRALARQDVDLLTTILVTREELQGLGVPTPTATKILEAVGDPAGHLRKIAATSKALQPRTRWMQFNGVAPGLILAEQLGARQDVLVYENSMAFVDFGGTNNSGSVQLGELVRIGNAWKLTGLPIPQDANQTQIMETGLLMQAGSSLSNEQPVVAQNGKISPKVQQLIEQLQEVDKLSPPVTADSRTHARYYEARLAALDRLVAATAGSDEDQAQWIRQIGDFLAAGIQSETYVAGARRLRDLEGQVRRSAPGTPLAVHIIYRRMLGEYTIEMKQANNDDRQKVQDRWMKEFEDFVTEYAKTEEAADAAWQIAVINEFNGKLEKARTWYERLVRNHAQSQSGERAVGALNRLNLVGKTLDLKGPTLQKENLDLQNYRGRLTLVVFWSTWCKPCTEELPQLKALYGEYRARGFEIVGINLDSQPELIQPFVRQQEIPWPSIFQPGGLESPHARQFGIISLPTMLLVDKSGKVINRNAAVVDVKNALTSAFKKKDE